MYVQGFEQDVRNVHTVHLDGIKLTWSDYL